MLIKHLRKAILALPICLLGIVHSPSGLAIEAPQVDPTGIGSLKGEPVALPDLSGIVRDRDAAIALGKAFFFDVNAGSDGQACASCHFAAGVDNRITNQRNPGEKDLRGHRGWGSASKDNSRGSGLSGAGNPAGPNTTLHPEDLPLHQLSDVKDRNSAIVSTTNDVIGSQGTHAGEFLAVTTDELTLSLNEDEPIQDNCGPSDARTFGNKSLSFRKTTGRNAPTTINAVFNHRNFWDGRANNVFNGVDNWGKRNQNARLIVSGSGGVELHKMRLQNASLASQAVAPVLSAAEASCDNRRFTAIAEKLLNLRALRSQEVSDTDSALGPYVDAAHSRGINQTYRQLVEAAFEPRWWEAEGFFRIDDSSGTPTLVTGQGSPQIVSNFSMFWGIAIMLWEAELISDDSPIDQFFDGTASLSESEALGMSVFLGKGKCVDCHSTAAFSRATTLYLNGTGEESIERMPMAKDKDGRDTPAALYDAGFYNIGVTPTVHDIALGDFDPWGNPLSFTRQYTRKLAGQDVADSILVDACNLEVRFGEDVRGFDDRIANANDKQKKIVSCASSEEGEHGPVSDTFTPKGWMMARLQRVAVDGAFKTPTLRNVGLTAPYFHNGGVKSLKEVVQLYNRGGNQRGDFRVEADGRDEKGMPMYDAEKDGDTTGSGILGEPLARHRMHAKRQAGKGSNLDANIERLDLTEEEQDALVDFMLALTDDRVACKKPPFDQPGLPLFKGQTGARDHQDWDGPRSDDNRTASGTIPMFPATGEGGLEAAGVPCLNNSGNLFEDRNMHLGEMLQQGE